LPSSSRIIAAVVAETTFVSDAMSYIVLSTDAGAPGAQSLRPYPLSSTSLPRRATAIVTPGDARSAMAAAITESRRGTSALLIPTADGRALVSPPPPAGTALGALAWADAAGAGAVAHAIGTRMAATRAT
jgi:hypothetical protein